MGGPVSDRPVFDNVDRRTATFLLPNGSVKSL
jgi:hypothetical protein